MSLFSKLFKLFLAVVFFPLLPLVLLLGYYQVHLKDNLLETHANLAEMVAVSMSQHVDNLSGRLAFASQLTDVLRAKKDPLSILKAEVAANPDFLMLAVLSKEGKELYRAGSSPVLKQVAPLDLRGNPALAEPDAAHLSVSHFDVIHGMPVTEFLYPLENGDYLYGLLSFFNFITRLQQQRIGSTGHIYILDAQGQVYADEFQYKPAFDAEELRQAFASGSNLIKKLRTPRDTYVGAYAPAPLLGAYVAVLQLRSEAYRGIYHTNIILALFLLTIFTLAYFGALTFAERLGEPIEALSQAAAEISRGNLDVHVEPDMGWGEFKHLIDSFNQMTADLKDYQNLRLQAQVSELKEQVFRSVAHDLRAPLMGLQGYIYILQNGDVSQEEKQNYLQLMAQAAQNLSALLEEVLDVSRLEAGMSTVQKQSVDVRALLNEVADTLRPTAEQKKLKMTVQCAVDRLPADPKTLKRVMMNLASNAVKFTEKGFVKLVATQTKKKYALKVEDSGIGLSAAEIKGLFQKYHQVHPEQPGYGLGLFISQQLVRAHGGTLEVTSTPGKGSTFTVWLPKETV